MASISRAVLIAPMTLAHFAGQYRSILQEAGFELRYPGRVAQLREDELIRELAGVVAVLAGSEPYTRRVIESCPWVRVIARHGVGYDAVDLQAATEAGMVVTTTPGSNHEAVAEHAFALMLGLAKNLITQHVGTAGGQWPRRTNLPLRGQNLGIVGLGRIGKAVAVRGRAFGMRVLAAEPMPDQRFIAEQQVELMPWERLLGEADFVTLHVPLTEETRYLINQKSLARMKPTAFLINTSRGGVVCEAELAQALQSGQIAGAGLDVYEEEPLHTSALFGQASVVLTPHVAGSDTRSREDMAASAAQAIVDIGRGEWPTEKVVNPEVKPRFRWELDPR